ncbi:MAG TPA: SHOCT domain-containing protein [Nocardioides sp.]|nr:SHOCT domain-containing protein [Nocardioides sp.]
MDSMTTSFGEVLLWSFWFFIWIAALTIWFRCLFDMFSDSTLSGWAKAGWAIFMIFIPWVGALVYLIVRGRSMSDRQAAAIQSQQAAQEQYIKQVAGSSADPVSRIADAKALLDSGAISETEFNTLKAKALAG